MSAPFLKQIAEHIFSRYKDNIENICVVLPGRRGALFLKHHLAATFQKTTWLPAIISAEDLITELSGLRNADEVELLCHLYESYCFCYGEKAEPFDSFAKWGQLILQDFNEIDRYLADPKQLYSNLKDIKVIENWSLGEENLSESQENYIAFMSSLGDIYDHFTAFLLSKKIAYQGLAYRQAVANLENTDLADRYEKILFCGFNALNKSEIKILEWLQDKKKVEFFWDADNYYLENQKHEAGYFLRRNFKDFPQKEISFVGEHFKEEKNIEIVSVPGQMGQAMTVKNAIQTFLDKGIAVDKIAVVLANEKLLWPVLRQLPKAVEQVNITMEYPLRYTATFSFIDSIFQIQLAFAKQERKTKHVYFKDMIRLLKHPLFNNLLIANKSKLNSNKIVQTIIQRNISFVQFSNLNEFFGEELKEIKNLFLEAGSVNKLNELLILHLNSLAAYYEKEQSDLAKITERGYMEVMLRGLLQLTELLKKYPHFADVRSYRQLFMQTVGNSSAPFIGEPLMGLQVMGVLESRTLDFENLIIVNVNEGVLPSGKTINSFIPNDLKHAFGLPLYWEKDAIYSYHFYRLLQRAKNICITHDSETDTFGKGEKSRFLTQLQLQMPAYNSEMKLEEKVAGEAGIEPSPENKISLKKDKESLSRIIAKATSNDNFAGLSPSSLLSYKSCSLRFYFRYGAGLKETEAVEESAEAGTFGNILHLALQNAYTPFIGKKLSEDDLSNTLKNAESIVKNAFKEIFGTSDLSGKSLLQFEVVKTYVEKQLKNDREKVKLLSKHNSGMVIKELEKEIACELMIDLNGTTEKVYIKGKIDRIDQIGKTIRVIDYKNSVSDKDKFDFEGMDDLFSEEGKNKMFQLFMYVWMLHKNSFAPSNDMIPGIIPFKSYDKEPKEIRISSKEKLTFSNELLDSFEEKLKKFIGEMLKSGGSFSQTEDLKRCEYCAYNGICMTGGE
jgi:ATP-dependent helicase/nuclease subunit B